METKLIKRVIMTSIVFAIAIKGFAQVPPEHREEYTVIPIDSIYLEIQGNKFALNKITTKSIRGLLGKPTSVFVYDEKDILYDFDKQITYTYEVLIVCFQSFEKTEWLHRIDFLNSNIPIIVNGVRLFAGMKDSVLNVFKKSWKEYQELENKKYYQDQVKRGDTEKLLTINFPIKTKSGYEYFGSVDIYVKDGIIEKIIISFQDIDNI